tara:strand:- start:3611 stop:4108 length:498 start_codon:yes stop_codon:yes gene_type:complete
MFSKKSTRGSNTVTGNNKNSNKVTIINQGRGILVNRNSQAYRNYLVKKSNAFTGKASKAKNASKGDRIRQLVHTYLSLAYEMGPDLKRKIFRKYILLIMHSIDKIAGSSTNFERYSQLYEEAESLTGIVDITNQYKSTKIILDILENAFRIDSSTSKKLISLLNF